MKKVFNKHNFTKKVVCCLLAAVLLFTVISAGGSVAVFHFLFKRTEYPKTTELYYSDIDAVRYPRREVYFTSGNNKLYGCFYEQENAIGSVLIVNGIYSDVDRHLSEIMYFLDHNWQVFTFDGTGVGKSEGDSIVGLPQTKLDLLAAVNYLQTDSSAKDLPVVVYGHSVGGYAAVTALAETDDISAVISIAGFNSPVETMKYHAKRHVGVLADVEYPFMWLQNRMVFGDDADVCANEVLNNATVPIAIIEGSTDTTVPAEIGIGRYAKTTTNPYVEYMLVDEPYRSGHSSIWLSKQAAEDCEKILTKNAKEKALKAEIRFGLNELDSDFMEYVNGFFEKAVSSN